MFFFRRKTERKRQTHRQKEKQTEKNDIQTETTAF